MGLSCSGSRAAIKTHREDRTGVYLLTGLAVQSVSLMSSAPSRERRREERGERDGGERDEGEMGMSQGWNGRSH